MLLIFILCAAALAPGIATAWIVHRRHGWLAAFAAGIGVTLALPLLLLASLVVFPPLGYAVALAAWLGALRAYDHGRIWVATAWAALAVVAFTCSGWGTG